MKGFWHKDRNESWSLGADEIQRAAEMGLCEKEIMILFGKTRNTRLEWNQSWSYWKGMFSENNSGKSTDITGSSTQSQHRSQHLTSTRPKAEEDGTVNTSRKDSTASICQQQFIRRTEESITTDEARFTPGMHAEPGASFVTIVLVQKEEPTYMHTSRVPDCAMPSPGNPHPSEFYTFQLLQQVPSMHDSSSQPLEPAAITASTTFPIPYSHRVSIFSVSSSQSTTPANFRQTATMFVTKNRTSWKVQPATSLEYSLLFIGTTALTFSPSVSSSPLKRKF